MDYTRKMLNEIRKRTSRQNTELPKSDTLLEKTNIVDKYKILMEEAIANKKKVLNEEEDKGQPFVIRSSDVQFGNVRNSQEDTLRKTIGDITLKDDALKYYPKIDDIVLNGEVNGLGVTFQFRYKDPSGDGCYIWSKGLQLTDSNNTTVDKIRDAFLNWKKSLVDDGDLLKKLNKEATKE